VRCPEFLRRLPQDGVSASPEVGFGQLPGPDRGASLGQGEPELTGPLRAAALKPAQGPESGDHYLSGFPLHRNL